MYRNAKYAAITDYQYLYFKNDNATLETLYRILKSFYSDENKKNIDYNVNLTIGKDQVNLSNTKKSGILFLTSLGYFLLTEKQVDKLFGKN